MRTSVSLIICVAVTGIIFAGGCDKNHPAEVAASAKDPNIAVSEVIAGTSDGLNDTERIAKIMNRMNRAVGSQYNIVFGNEVMTAGNQIAVDYVLFDRLSDDAVAAMIASAIARDNLNDSTETSSIYMKTQPDRLAGQYIARARFNIKGYSEWLTAQQEFSPQRDPADISDRSRVDAFLQGYESVNPITKD